MPAAGVSYQIAAFEQEGLWIARATRDDTGQRFGIESSGRTEREAVDRLRLWLDWQRDHTAALDALQNAERSYHRLLANRAFTGPSPDAAAAAERQRSLDALEAARVTLDRIRARRPETHA